MVFSKNVNCCPYCGGTSKTIFRISSGIFKKCRKCDLIFRHRKRAPNYGGLVSLYGVDHFGRDSVEHQAQNRIVVFNHLLDEIEKVKKSGKLLDVGSGSGLFLRAAKERGWQVKGVEPSAKSARIASRKLGLDVVEGTLKDLRDNAKFDVITMINVLDQSGEPWRELDEARGLLKDRGVIFIRVPNGQLHSLLVRVGARVAINDRFRKYLVFHEYSFTAKFLSRLLRDKGFKSVIIRSSLPSQGDPYNLFVSSEAAKCIKAMLNAVAQFTEALTFKRIHLGTSLESMAVSGGD